jgi:cytochrome c-type biogenesis protein CcmH
MTGRRFPLWWLLGAVLVLALVIGSGVLSSSAPTAAQRASAIESVVRCPSCQDLSVAQSSAPTALAVRVAVGQQISEGRTDQQIKDYLVARYGASIVLDPPASGWSLMVWLLPVVGGGVAVVLLVAVLIRRRGGAIPAPGDEGGSPLAPDVAEERRLFLVKSLEDADAEYLAGDLADKDYLAIRQRDMVRLAALRPPAVSGSGAPAPALATTTFATEAPAETLPTEAPVEPSVGAGRGGEEPGAADSVATGRRARGRRSWWFLGGAVTAFAAALVVAVSMFASSRQPGQSATGSIAQSQQQQIAESLAQAASQENAGNLGQAAQLYQSVLNQHPDNEVALAQLGWLEYKTERSGASTALLADARAKLQLAVQLDPKDYAVRLYLGTVALQQDGNAGGAVDQYRQFLADGPPAALVAQAAPQIRDAFQKAGLAVPTQVARG